MLKSSRVLFGIGILLFFLLAIPLSTTHVIRNTFYSFLKGPLVFSSQAAQVIQDVFYFRRNAQENRYLKQRFAEIGFKRVELEEFSEENKRLTKLLDLRRILPPGIHRSVFCRVIGRSSFKWNGVLLIDKGVRQGVKANMLVLAELSVIGKVIETGPDVSQVRLVADPNSRIGVVIQRTRQQGILFGTLTGECRVKYIQADSDLKMGDVIETAGFGGFLPKGLVVGTVARAWKEPGQIYQVAEVKPLVDLNRIEEVVCIE